MQEFPMKNLLRVLFGGSAAQPVFRSSGAPSTMQTDSEAINRQQLVMLTVRDVMRVSGIPPDWVDCQTLNVNSRRRGTGLYIHMVITHWDERLLRVTCAFQAELRSRIERFDPKAAQWVHGISWQMAMEDSCPFDKLPDKSHWASSTIKAPVPVAPTGQTPNAHYPAVLASAPAMPAQKLPEPVNFQPTQPIKPVRDPAQALSQDLQALFAIRDAELKQAKSRSPLPPAGFEQTEPSPLNR